MMVIEWMLVRLGQVGGLAWGQASTTWIFFRCWHSMWMWKMPRHMVVCWLLVGWEEVESVWFGCSVGLETGGRRIKVDKGGSVGLTERGMIS